MLNTKEFEQIMTSLLHMANPTHGMGGRHFGLKLEEVYAILRTHSDKTVSCEFHYPDGDSWSMTTKISIPKESSE